MNITMFHIIKPENKTITTHFEGNIETMVRLLKPFLKGHKPRTENGIKKILKEEYNDKIKSDIRFRWW